MGKKFDAEVTTLYTHLVAKEFKGFSSSRRRVMTRKISAIFRGEMVRYSIIIRC